MNAQSSPLILIGAARSGTKFLRDVIATSSAYDRVPYDVNYVWRRGNEALDHDQIDQSTLTPQRAKKIRNSLERLVAKEAGENPQAMVEKTVSNTLRVPFVDAVYPNARFIHIIRDGRAVIESSLRMWQAPPDRSGLLRKLRDLPLDNLGYVAWFARNYLRGMLRGRSGGEVWGPRYQGIADDLKNESLLTIVTRQWSRSVEKATTDLNGLPTDRVFAITYEELVSDEGRMEALCAFADIPDTEMVLGHMRKILTANQNEKWRQSLTDDDLKIIDREAGLALELWGYKSGS